MTDIVKRLRDPQLHAEIKFMRAEAAAEIERLRFGYTLLNEEVCQRLGKALGYPWFKDDQENFPGATEENGVCTGEHVAESIAAEAARYIINLEAKVAWWNEQSREMLEAVEKAEAECGRLREAVQAFLSADDHWLRGNKGGEWAAMMAVARAKAFAALGEAGHE